MLWVVLLPAGEIQAKNVCPWGKARPARAAGTSRVPWPRALPSSCSWTAHGAGLWTCQFVSLAYTILIDMGKNLAFSA